MPELPIPPVAKQIPLPRAYPGGSVVDDGAIDEYQWLRDTDDPDLIPLLEAENAYADAVLTPQKPLAEKIYGEIRDRTRETDLSVPYRYGDRWYYRRTVEGLPYAIHCRRADDGTGAEGEAGAGAGAEQVILDLNVLAEGRDYVDLGALKVSPDGRLLAYSVDFTGDEKYTLHVKDLGEDSLLDVEIPATAGDLAWAADSATLLYTTLDDTWRPWRLHRHTIGVDAADGSADVLAHQEDDARFDLDVWTSRSGDFVLLSLYSETTSEVRLIDAHDPLADPRVVLPRRDGVKYSVEHQGKHLYVLSDDGAPNGALWRTPLSDTDRARREFVLPHDEHTKLSKIAAFAGHLVVHLRRAGVPGIAVLDTSSGPTAGTWRDLPFDEEVRTVREAVNSVYDTTAYHFVYESLVTPHTVYAEDLATGERTMLKRQEVLGGYDPGAYASARTWATAPDGTRVPVSFVHRRDTPLDGSAPALLSGYGAYERNIDPWFSAERLSLLDRGAVWALAHVRGGGELGRAWYENGKFLAKPNSFSDFVACADHLASTGIADGARIAARGRSGGGLLVGAALNLAPDRFRAAVAEVPFVDPLNTVLDPSLPLSVTDWEEWGDPTTDPEIFACMKAYSPYENITARPYPAIYATGGLTDPRVGYHEPVKWVQRLRATVPADPDRPILLRTEMNAGHGGPTGRYEAWRREAEILAFVLHQTGLANT